MSEVLDAVRERNRATWSAGDWDAVADNITAVGPRLLERLGVGPGARLLDVGTGSGSNVAIPAAQRGADVVGLDCTSAWFDAGRRRAAEAGVEVEWVEGEAGDLPFDDASFDVVTSTFGHMFEFDQAAAARELVRVCKPGGSIGYAAWTPTGKTGSMFRVLAGFMPPPPEGWVPPVMWGDEQHARSLLEPLGVEVEPRVQAVDFEEESVDAMVEHMTTNFGPMVMARAAIGEERWPEAVAALRAQFAADNEATDGSWRSTGEYLEVVARKPA